MKLEHTVPYGMLVVATSGVAQLWNNKPSAWNPSQSKDEIAEAAVQAATVYLSKNPIEPTQAQLADLLGHHMDGHGEIKFGREALAGFLARWQKYMFLVPEDEFKKSCGDLIEGQAIGGKYEKTLRDVFERGRNYVSS